MKSAALFTHVLLLYVPVSAGFHAMSKANSFSASISLSAFIRTTVYNQLSVGANTEVFIIRVIYTLRFLIVLFPQLIF